jgi:hypothetical protein
VSRTLGPNGLNSFSVEHLIARASDPNRIGDYENLLYACCSCNSARESAPEPVDPFGDPLARHLELTADGTLAALTPHGALLIDVCRLNRPTLVSFRKRICTLLDWLLTLEDAVAEMLAEDLLTFPDDLPNLAVKRPPAGNSNPQGVIGSAFELRRQGSLPEVY